jgi:hypothetical protein
MRNADALMRVYEELAGRFAAQNEPRSRDHFLVLAADAAVTAGHPEEAERLRQRLLQMNPYHLLKPFGSMAEALQAPDVGEYVADLRRQWPPEAAMKLHQSGPEPAAPPSPLQPRVAQTVPWQAGPGAKESPAARPAQAKQLDVIAEPAPIPLARKATAASVPSARPAPIVASPLVPVSAPAVRPAPPQVSAAATDHAPGSISSMLATLLLVIAMVGGAGLLFLALVWPLLK